MQVIKLEKVNSTNVYAKSIIEDLRDKTIIHAKRQTNGRGRLNRLWIDLGEGNLFFSIVLKPSKEFKPVYSNLTQYACLCLCKILEKYNINPKIKWPNDVMIDGTRKISGILCETVIKAGELKGIVLGIGINLNATKLNVENIPDRVVTALNLEIGKTIDSEIFLDDYLTEFFNNYDKFLNKGFALIENEYITRNCFLNKNINIAVLDKIKTGYASNLTPEGALVLRQPNDKELVLTIGDIL